MPRAPLYSKELAFRVSRSYGPGRYDAEYEERGVGLPAGLRAMERAAQHGGCARSPGTRPTIPRGPDRRDRAHRGRSPSLRAPDGRAGRAAARGDWAPSIRLVRHNDSRAPVATPAQTSRRAVSKSSSPSVGFIGCGNFARQVLVPTFRACGARLELVGGGSGPSADAAVRHLGFARTAATEERVIDDPAIDEVVISTRHASHARLTARALAAGKHVFCESRSP